MEKRIIRLDKVTIDEILKQKYIKLAELETRISCKEDLLVLKEQGCTILCAKGMRLIVWIGKKSASLQMREFEINCEKCISKDLE